MTVKPSGFITLKNSDKATGTSWGYRCSMLWEEKTASTDSVETEDMSVMVPTKSGRTDSSISKRNSFQSAKPAVERSLRLVPHPTWRKVFMGFCLKARECTQKKPHPLVRGGVFDIYQITNYMPASTISVTPIVPTSALILPIKTRSAAAKLASASAPEALSIA